MVLCHSMNAGSVVGYHEIVGTLKTYYLWKRYCLNYLRSQVAGTQILRMPALASEPPGETFTIFRIRCQCIFTARNEVGQGNIFRSVCQEFCSMEFAQTPPGLGTLLRE